MPDTIVYRELSSLEKDLGFSAKALYSISNHPSKHYRKTYVPKNNGEYRILYVPDDFMKAVQKKIAGVLLSGEPISPYATAYRFGGSTKINAAPHVGAPVLLKLDIRHFFDNITYWQVKSAVFPEGKYSESLRILLTMLCVFHDCLPQGAPTSPAISNIIMREFDNVIGDWCGKNQIHYTRYCDDMTFSGNFVPDSVIKLVESELRKLGFFLNHQKTTIVRDGQRKTVTGLVVNEKLSISNSYKRKIRQELYFCRKYGVASHMQKALISGTEQEYLQSLYGRISYVLSVEHDNIEFRHAREYLSNLLCHKQSDTRT